MMSYRVLVLDDDEDNLFVLEESLRASGFDVHGARSCAEARALLATGDIDALVTDYSLGDGTAPELLSSVGTRRPRATVLVTGYSSPESRSASRAAGFDAHLVKPIVHGDLVRALRECLEPSRC